MELDARTIPDGTTIEADLCIVGAGPVGLSLANALLDSGLQVVVIESGNVTLDADVQELNAGDTMGDAYRELQTSRSRSVGGTTAIWNTRVRGEFGAKYLPFDPIDFEAKEWAPHSGWSIQLNELEPDYRAAHALCGLGRYDYRAEGWSDAAHPLVDLSGSALSTTVYQYGQAGAFGKIIRSRLSAAPTTTLLHGATVTELVRGASGSPVSEVRWRTITGGAGAVCAKRFVLAAGGIENARLLLLAQVSQRIAPNDWIGRGFMEHPIDRSLELISRDRALAGDGSFYVPHDVADTPAVMGRISIAPELLRELRVPNASVRLLEEEGPPLLQSGAPRSAARRLVPFPAARRFIGNSIRSAAALRNRMRGVRYQLMIDLEQLPHRDNRVVLSSKVDRFGLPRAELHWRWREAEEAARITVRDAIARELTRAGVGRTRVNSDRPLDPNAHHHAGTTRMHPDPREGVVDETLRVHGEENLHVVGSSVFPTAGFANPTLTAIALALRLAGQLRASRRA